MSKRILLSGSSTGGHIYPIYALGEYLKNTYDITYLGIKNQLEEKIFPENSIFLNVSKSYKENLRDNEFRKEIKEYKKMLSAYDIYISAGGISTFLINQFIKNKPLFLLEQNVVLGDANKLFGLKAKKIFLSYPLKTIYAKKSVLSGNPSFARFQKTDVEKNKIIFMFGSLSSSSLEQKTLNYFYSPLFIKNKDYIFVSKKKNLNLPSNIQVIDYLDVNKYLDPSNLFFVRAGGSSSYELMYFNIPCVFIPSPYVKHQHQKKNAEYFESKYHYPMLLEKDYNNQNIYKYLSMPLKKYENSLMKINTLRIIKEIIDENI